MVNKAKLVAYMIVIICNLCFSVAGRASSTPYILVDTVSGKVLASNHAFDKWYPASLTKLMTIYIVFNFLEHGLLQLSDPIYISKNAAKAPPSKIGFKVGEVIDLDSAIKSTLVRSANDVAIAIAESVGGSVAKFTALMNMQAQALHMRDTHFSNPTGLPDKNNYTTAYDMALLALAIRKQFPQYWDYFSIYAVKDPHNAKMLYNSNPLIGKFAGIDGMKTGFICDSGFNIIVSATRGRRSLLAVTLGHSVQSASAEMAASLLEQGFARSPYNGINLRDLKPINLPLSQARSVADIACRANKRKVK